MAELRFHGVELAPNVSRMAFAWACIEAVVDGVHVRRTQWASCSAGAQPFWFDGVQVPFAGRHLSLRLVMRPAVAYGPQVAEQCFGEGSADLQAMLRQVGMRSMVQLCTFQGCIGRLWVEARLLRPAMPSRQGSVEWAASGAHHGSFAVLPMAPPLHDRPPAYRSVLAQPAPLAEGCVMRSCATPAEERPAVVAAPMPRVEAPAAVPPPLQAPASRAESEDAPLCAAPVDGAAGQAHPSLYVEPPSPEQTMPASATPVPPASPAPLPVAPPTPVGRQPAPCMPSGLAAAASAVRHARAASQEQRGSRGTCGMSATSSTPSRSGAFAEAVVKGRAFAGRLLHVARTPMGGAGAGHSFARSMSSGGAASSAGRSPVRRLVMSVGTPLQGRSSMCATSSAGGNRLSITEKGKADLVELMHNKDKLRFYAERPFKVGPKETVTRLTYEMFCEALRALLSELEIKVPQEPQMRALFEKHSRDERGMDLEGYEALLFRLLCFLRASEEVRVKNAQRRSGVDAAARDKRWREEFLQTNPAKFGDVYELQKQLGKGSFGTCYMVAHRTQHDANNERRMRVCKIISKAKAKEAKTPEEKVREEFAVLKQLDHPHVLRIFEDFEDEENFYVIMEPCRGGDLQDYVKCLEPMDAITYERWVGKVMQHTLSAIAYCHARAVIHKDLKPENVMLSTPKNTPIQDMHVVVVDFGLSEMFSHPTDRSSVISGTPPYMAPEVWQGSFGRSCDIWSVGVMLFFLLSGRLPFMAGSVKEFPKAVLAEPDWALMGGATPEGQRFCKQMLQKKEHLRPPATRALKDRWFEALGMDRCGPQAAASALDPLQIDSLLSVGQRTEFEKFVTRFVATQLDASKQRSVNDAFRAFDTDGDGLLSKEELTAGLAMFGASRAVAQEVAKELDIGRSGQVSYTEFLAGVISLRGKQPEEQDKLLWLAWQQFSPDEQGHVRVSAIQDALAARGMAVADLPESFLDALKGSSASTLTFDNFKEVLLQDSSGQVVRTLTGERLRGAKFMRWLMKRLSSPSSA